MSQIDWVDMMHYQQQMQKIIRKLLPVKQTRLTVSECELLAWLYMEQEKNTPVLLSQSSGMKKEAVSRCLKSLIEKNCIIKQKQSDDERSYAIFITETGIDELNKGYENILKPFYDMWRTHGDDFKKFLEYADKIVSDIEKEQE